MNSYLLYIISFALGMFIGSNVLPVSVTIILVFILLFLIIKSFYSRKYIRGLSYLCFLLLLEPYIRAYLVGLPYSLVQYILLIVAVKIIFDVRRVKPAIPMWLWSIGIVTLFEVIRVYSFIEWENTKSIVLNSLVLFSMCYLGIVLRVNKAELLVLVRNFTYSGFLLAGVVAIAHFKGEIDYSLNSNFVSSNGMAPVQLSFYLGITLYVLYYYNEYLIDKSVGVWIYFFIAIQSIIMILTFSRGGVYFVLALLSISLISDIRSFLRPKNLRSIILVAISAIVSYYYAFKESGGLIKERFAEEGASNREIIASAGIKMFNDNPMGIGTGNFHFEISKREYFGAVTGAHNEFIRILTEQGLLIFIFYLVFFIFLFISILKSGIFNKYKVFAISMVLSFIFGAVHNGLKIGMQCFVMFLAILTYKNLDLKNSNNVQF